jgi:putative membrane protein insertion efficiency factor
MKLISGIIAIPFIAMIRLYQILLSPLLPSTCRFEPTCSSYAIQAIKEWGVFRGIVMATKRIISCRPGGKYGYDPVPKKESV